MSEGTTSKISKILIIFTLLIAVLTISSAEESHADDFDSYSVGTFPEPWNDWQDTSCGESDCKNGYSMIADNYSISDPNSLECLEKTAGTRRCFIEADVKLYSNLSLHYNLDLAPLSNFARISLFRNNSGTYSHVETIDELTSSSSSQSTTGEIDSKQLKEYAGTELLIGIEVSGEGDGSGRAIGSIDNFILNDGGRLAQPINLEKRYRNIDNQEGASTEPFVLGRKVNSTYSYEIKGTYFPIDTALVIDSSGSMDPSCCWWLEGENVLDDAKAGSKKFVDETNTVNGDRNAVVDFDNEGEILQSLTSSKVDAKDSIDSIEGGGGTNTAGGIEKGYDALISGKNPYKALILLADGVSTSGEDPKIAADNARAEGVIIHGIMYGNNVDTAEFEDITNSTDCSLVESENEDDDNCWYATEDSVSKVYEQIRTRLEKERSANMSMVIPNYSRTETSYDSLSEQDGFKEFTRVEINLSEGNHTESLEWTPVDYFSPSEEKLVAPGRSDRHPSSRIRFKSGQELDYFIYSTKINRKVLAVNFTIIDANIVREGSEINVSLKVKNTGTAESKQNTVRLTGSGSNIDRNLPELSPGETHTFKFELTDENPIFSNREIITAEIDPEGRWNSIAGVGIESKGAVLEPNESDNSQKLGFPPEYNNVDPDKATWDNNNFQPNFSFTHPNPANISGNYNLTWEGSRNETNSIMGATNTSQDVFLTTNSYDINNTEVSYQFDVNVSDSYGAITYVDEFFLVDNPKPVARNPSPEQNGLINGFPTTLEITVDDENSNDLDVTFYEAGTGSTIDTETSVSRNTRIDADWTPPNTNEKFYTWIVEVTDDVESANYTFEFNKVTGSISRTDLSLEFNHSAILMNSGNSRYVRMTVANNALSTKNLTLTLEDSWAEFLDGSKTKTIEQLEARSKETVTIRITPETVMDAELTLISTNNDIGLNSTKNIPVKVVPNTREGNSVPGMGTAQLLFLVAFSTVLYFARL